MENEPTQESAIVSPEDVLMETQNVQAGPSTSSRNTSILEGINKMHISKAANIPEGSKIFDKYLSGEIALDDYEMLLDEEHHLEASQLKTDEYEPKATRVTRKIPPHVKALIGEANIRFARGEHETAKKMCYEIIRQFSAASEPYITLAQIFEHTDPGKCLDYYMVAALCSPRDVDLWVRCAQLSVTENKVNQAIFCYTNAVRVQPKNIQLHLKRIQLLRKEKDNKNMLRSYVKMMQYLTPTYYDFLLQVAVRVAGEYHQLKEYKKAIDALNIPFQKCPSLVTLQMVNILLELLLLNENYSYALDIFLEYCNIEIEVFLDDEQKIQILSYHMPEGIPIDLRIKFIICAIKLESFHLLNQLLAPLLIMEDEVEMVGDLFLDVVEVLMAANRHEDALKLLVPLIKSNNYSLAGVWLKYADCQRACEMYEPAIDSYRSVMRMAPLHIEVKYNLAEVLAKIDRKSEALAILNQDPNVQEIDLNLLILKIKLLKELGEFEEYWKSVDLLLSRHCIPLRHYEEIRAVMYLERPLEKEGRIKKLRRFRGEGLDEKAVFTCAVEPSVEAEYTIFREAADLCMQQQNYPQMQKLIFTSLTSPRFKNKYDELSLLGFFASLYNKDSYHAYPLIREIVIHHSDNNLAWNLFNVLLQQADDLRHTRFMMRFLSSYSQNPYLRLLEANYCLSIGNVKIGLGYYLSKLRSQPTPMTCMLLGCLLLYTFGQRVTQNKQKVTRTAIALFLKYSTMRSQDAFEEINYNLGRMYQQFGLVHLAKYYYNLVLEYEAPLAKRDPNLSLKHEAAYNLHIIYKNSKNFIAARNVLMKHLRI